MCLLCRSLSPSMQHRGPSNVVEHVGFEGASSWPPALDSQPVTWEEFKGVFMDRFIPRSMRVVRDREFKLLK